MSVELGEQKLAELILYISQRCANEYYFGETKLHKILFFADFTAFGTWGGTVSDAQYHHQPNGPMVHRMIPVTNALIAERALAIQPTNCGGYRQNRPVNLREPNLSFFTADEIALVDGWIERLRGMTAAQLSKLSHDTAAWRFTRDFDKIDPRSVFIAWREPNAAEIIRGRELAIKHGLLA